MSRGAPPLPFAEACERNKAPILDVLRTAFAQARRVLEIGSGTGQHAVHFARALPHLVWQPTDRDEWLDGLAARIAAEGPSNLLPPLRLDVRDDPWPVAAVDAVFGANTLHIMSEACVEAFFHGVARVLEPGGTLCVYGPFRYCGRFTTDSNAAFDAWLKARDPLSGIRDFERVDALARTIGCALLEDHAMPANNQCLVWRRTLQCAPPPTRPGAT